MTNFERLKQMTPEEFAKFVMDGTEHNDFFIMGENEEEGTWVEIHDFIKWLGKETTK